MKLPVVFDPAAQAEFADAVAWYENQKPGLGLQFMAEVERAVERAQSNPGRFPKIRQKFGRVRLRRFSKYTVYFAIRGDWFAVIAVFHASRNPEVLHPRLS